MTTNHNNTRYASSGAVNQNGGTLPIRNCKTCNAEMVWCKSNKTGKHYPVNVRYSRENRAAFYRGDDIHRCASEVTVWAVITTEADKRYIAAKTNDEGSLAREIERVIKWAAADGVTEALVIKMTTREPETYLSNGWVGADHWVLEGETVQTLTFGGAK